MARFASIFHDYAAKLREIAARKVFVTAEPASGKLLGLQADAETAEETLSRRAPDVSPDAVETLLRHFVAHPPKGPVLVDIALAAQVHAGGASAKDSVKRARIRFQGTDGIRGKIGQDEPGHEAELFFRDGTITPRLFAAVTAAFIDVARNKIAPPGKVAFADDGRDYLTSKRFRNAVLEAVRSRGMTPVDLGVIPTPLVPVYCATAGIAAGIVLTASHNPANQNGIKFFLDGRKILPEGAVSDYAISALAFEMLARADSFVAVSNAPAVEPGPDAGSLAILAAEAVLRGKVGSLKRFNMRFLVDTAHGAYSSCAAAVFDKLGLPYEILNGDATGENINRGSGVAVIEGTEIYERNDAGAPEIARRLSAAGLAKDKRVLGIALDGDGDRGFVLVPDNSGRVRVLDGDKLSFLIARYLKEAHGMSGRFVGTVESDLALFTAVETRLGLPVEMVCVGDKYLSSTPRAQKGLLIGEEASGHVVLPCKIGKGRGGTILTGNGLISGILGAEALVWTGNPVENVHPYKPGVMKTFYTYFVDKTRLRRGGTVWAADIKAAQKGLTGAILAQELPSSTQMAEQVFPDDEDMLYLSIVAEGSTIGVVFTRASGTEDKVAVYARGGQQFAKGILGIAREVVRNHALTLKDRRRPEAQAEAAILNAAGTQVGLTAERAMDILRKAGITMAEPSVHSLLTAMRKQGF